MGQTLPAAVVAAHPGNRAVARRWSLWYRRATRSSCRAARCNETGEGGRRSQSGGGRTCSVPGSSTPSPMSKSVSVRCGRRRRAAAGRGRMGQPTGTGVCVDPHLAVAVDPTVRRLPSRAQREPVVPVAAGAGVPSGLGSCAPGRSSRTRDRDRSSGRRLTHCRKYWPRYSGLDCRSRHGHLGSLVSCAVRSPYEARVALGADGRGRRAVTSPGTEDGPTTVYVVVTCSCRSSK